MFAATKLQVYALARRVRRNQHKNIVVALELLLNVVAFAISQAAFARQSLRSQPNFFVARQTFGAIETVGNVSRDKLIIKAAA